VFDTYLVNWFDFEYRGERGMGDIVSSISFSQCGCKPELIYDFGQDLRVGSNDPDSRYDLSL